MEIKVPDFTAKNVLQLSTQLNAITPQEDLVLDFSGVHTFDPFAMLLGGCVIRQYRVRFPDIGFQLQGVSNKSYPGTMGFFKYISPLISIGKLPGEAAGSNTYIPITKISVMDLHQKEIDEGNCIHQGQAIEKEAHRLSSVLDRGNTEIHALLTYLIREIIRNAPEHAQCNDVWICGQYWPSYSLAEIAILDEGIGIYNSLVQNPVHKGYIFSNLTAISWAVKAGISQSLKPSQKQRADDDWANSGFGLYMVSQICSQLEGYFTLASGGNYLSFDKSCIGSGDTYFNGTAIRMRIKTDELTSTQKLISKIASEGEAQAKTIRHAFKTASIPSRGLLESL